MIGCNIRCMIRVKTYFFVYSFLYVKSNERVGNWYSQFETYTKARSLYRAFSSKSSFWSQASYLFLRRTQDLPNPITVSASTRSLSDVDSYNYWQLEKRRAWVIMFALLALWVVRQSCSWLKTKFNLLRSDSKMIGTQHALCFLGW